MHFAAELGLPLCSGLRERYQIVLLHPLVNNSKILEITLYALHCLLDNRACWKIAFHNLQFECSIHSLDECARCTPPRHQMHPKPACILGRLNLNCKGGLAVKI